MTQVHLYMVLTGCTPPGRHTEQHDIFFGIAGRIEELKEQLIAFWPEALGKLHVDAFRRVSGVDGYHIRVADKKQMPAAGPRLFFLNLGGYKENQFEEFHYKMLVVAENKGEAIQKAKQSSFYLHTGFAGANSHIDDKYGVDVDDVYEITDILPEESKSRYSLVIESAGNAPADPVHLGYFKLDKLNQIQET